MTMEWGQHLSILSPVLSIFPKPNTHSTFMTMWAVLYSVVQEMIPVYRVGGWSKKGRDWGQVLDFGLAPLVLCIIHRGKILTVEATGACLMQTSHCSWTLSPLLKSSLFKSFFLAPSQGLLTLPVDNEVPISSWDLNSDFQVVYWMWRVFFLHFNWYYLWACEWGGEKMANCRLFPS